MIDEKPNPTEVPGSKRDGNRMLGPLERHRCPDHPRKWITFRWVWPVPADGDNVSSLESDSEPETVHDCVTCVAKHEAEERRLLFGGDDD